MQQLGFFYFLCMITKTMDHYFSCTEADRIFIQVKNKGIVLKCHNQIYACSKESYETVILWFSLSDNRIYFFSYFTKSVTECTPYALVL